MTWKSRKSATVDDINHCTWNVTDYAWPWQLTSVRSQKTLLTGNKPKKKKKKTFTLLPVYQTKQLSWQLKTSYLSSADESWSNAEPWHNISFLDDLYCLQARAKHRRSTKVDSGEALFPQPLELLGTIHSIVTVTRIHMFSFKTRLQSSPPPSHDTHTLPIHFNHCCVS